MERRQRRGKEDCYGSWEKNSRREVDLLDSGWKGREVAGVGVELLKPWVIKVVMATFLIIWSSICIPVVAMPFYPPTWKTVNEKNDPDKIQ